MLFMFSQEKELENLAAMDLELQKIAEKFNDNRRGWRWSALAFQS